MQLRLRTTIAALAASTILLLTAAPSADASIITMQFTGTVSEQGGPVFGEGGSAIPFDLSLTYDTSKGSQVALLNTLRGGDIWGYSSAGITAVNMTFGTKTWTLDDLQSTANQGQSAHLWANTDLTLAAPTAVHVYFNDADGAMVLGYVFYKTSQALLPDVGVSDYWRGGFVAGSYTLSTSVAPSAVPEPTSLLFLGSGLVGLVARLRTTKRRAPMKQL